MGKQAEAIRNLEQSLAMSDRRISVHDRVAALERLNAVAWELNGIAAWLADCGVETEADMIERAARDLLAACWLLGRPLRPQLPPGRWQQAAPPAAYPVNGYPQGG